MTTTFDLTVARLNAGLSHRALAKATGVSPIVVKRLEAGLRAHPANAKKIADFFGVLVTDLMPLPPEEPFGPERAA